MNIYQWLCLFAIPSLFLTIFTGIVKALSKKVRKVSNENEAIKLGIQALLRDRLMQAFTYYEQRGWAGQADRDNIDNMYTQYETLGRNGVMDTRYAQFKKLPFQDLANHNNGGAK